MNPLKKIVKFYRHVFFPGSERCWEGIYAAGGTSGEGSYGRLAEFKAEVLNKFVKDNKIKSVIEFGCGDGNQLAMFDFPNYIGLDVSKTAVEKCAARFKSDTTKSFYYYVPERFDDRKEKAETKPIAELSISLDVIFHLIEDNIFNLYMKHLFESSCKFVIIYSSDIDAKRVCAVRHRKFTAWVEANKPEWKLVQKIPNRYPNPNKNYCETFGETSYKQGTSNCSFYIYKKDGAEDKS